MDSTTAFLALVFAAIVALFACVAAGIYAIAHLFPDGASVREARRRRGQCADCGYSLTGNASGTCPECGTPTGAAPR